MPKQDYFEKGQLTDLVYLVLLSLIKPKHGYLIMNEVATFTEGNVKIGPASLYTTIKKLLDYEYIALIGSEDKKKIYQVTPKGLEMLLAEIEKRKKLVDYGVRALKEYEMKNGGKNHETL